VSIEIELKLSAQNHLNVTGVITKEVVHTIIQMMFHRVIELFI